MKIKHHDWLLYGMLACAVGADDWELGCQMEGEAINAHHAADGNGPYKKFVLGEQLYCHPATTTEKLNMTTINRTIRETIISRALRDHNKEAKASLKADLRTFGDSVYEQFFGEDEATVYLLKNSAWYEMAEDVSIECTGFGFNTASKADAMLPLSKPRPMPCGIRRENADVFIGPTHALWDDAQRLAKRHQDLYEADRVMTKEIEAVLAKCRTVKQLAEVWPEGMRYLHDSESTKQPPPEVVEVNMVKRVNEKLGLR